MSDQMTLADYAKALQSGETTAQALIDNAFAKIECPDGEGARVFTSLYKASATIAAQASDGFRKIGAERSELEGIPISVKDLFNVRGEPTLAGSVVLKDSPPAPENAEVVKRLQATGAIIVGKTNMTEFAYSGLGINPHYGTPKNTWDRATGRIPGGSSSGAAISVTDGMCAAAIGSDTGGSVRIPAALNGLVGFKPTARRVSMKGVLPLSAYLDSIGPIAPTVGCCAAVDRVLSGDEQAVTQQFPLKGLRLAIPTTVLLDGQDSHVAAAFSQAVSRLSQAGASVQEISIPAFARLSTINAKGGFTASEAWTWHQHLIEQSAAQYDPRVVSRILRGKDMSAADFIELLRLRTEWIAEVTDTIAPFDGLIMPTVPIIAPSIAELSATDEAYFKANGLMLRNPTFINFLDGCALSIPCHQAGEAPVGLMLAGTAMSDRKILAMGLSVEEAVSPRR